MPVYTFKCKKCDDNFVVTMTIKDYNNSQRCPICSSEDTCRNFSEDNIIGIESEPRSVGMLAEKNAKKMRSE